MGYRHVQYGMGWMISPIRPLSPGVGDLISNSDPTSQWLGAAVGIGGFLLLMTMIGKGARRKSKSQAAYRRVMEY